MIFFGEFHDSQPIHAAELDVLKGLYELHGDKLVYLWKCLNGMYSQR